MTLFIEFIKSVAYGILEGITEWLPVSSTGHLILLEEYLRLNVSPDPVFCAEYSELFDVVIQLGAVAAVAVICRDRLFSPLLRPSGRGTAVKLWGLILLASLPAAFAGTVLDAVIEKITGRDIDGWLYTPAVVAAALIIWGIFFIIAEKHRAMEKTQCDSVFSVSPRDALKIGAFQTFSLIPGTSRSGSTILGGLFAGLDRGTAAEFSFFMAIPVMVGASLVKIAGFAAYVCDSSVSVPAAAWLTLAAGTVTAFIVSLCVIRFLTDFVKKHTFLGFAVYRIVLGTAVLIFSVLKD